ncbi:TonB-dependent receptor [Pseudoxanthomonas sp. PXM02]|uniref:TonB-dependent receptor domain-containing protein n=1 Tax=Pseudoxanthomonas sp. PXM02 TaxID=2769294 RepID=UPI00177EFF9A|nr:TonB-dependent receptor [Pseudoxanthomonas sp. PXM02]MBD9479587.1 TonB-dependent receptor [Pseudoxanthomonas sp. PXM02]
MTHTRFSGRACLRRHRLAVAVIALTAAPAFAQIAPNGATDATDLDTVVVTAAGFEQKITDAPASISVITREELSKRPYMTLLDAVRDLEGVDVGETRDKTGQGTISMRGMGSDYTLILVNGKRQNNHGDIYPNSFQGNQFNHIPPLDAIERIEVIRGPMSTLYGADAMGGVINIITKRTLDSWHGSATLARTFESDDQFGDDSTADLFVTGPLVPGTLSLSARASWYQRDASNPVYASATDPSGVVHQPSLGFGGGGKTVDNTNKAGGISLAWTPTDSQTITLDYDVSRQEYDNAIKINDDGVEEYPVGTVDNYGAVLRIGNNGRVEPRAGYAPTQEFTRDSWTLTHEGNWGFGNSFVSLSHVATNNDGRTLPFTVDQRQELQTLWNAACTNLGGTVGGSGYCAPGTAIGYNNANAWNNLSEARKLEVMRANLNDAQYAALMGTLPRPKRTLESAQYTLDAKLDIPFELAGEHTAVIGTQVIRGELTDGVFGMEAGVPGGTQDHNMYSLFVEDTWKVLAPFSLTGGVRYDNHDVFGSHVSPRLYGVYSISSQWTVKGGISTGFKTPKTTQLYDGVTGFGGQGTSPMFGNPDLQPETSTSTEIATYWEHPAGHTFNLTLFRNEFDDKIASQPCGANFTLVCSSTGEYAELGYSTSTKTVNIDEVVIQGAEVAGRWQIVDSVSFRANYTYTDSEQNSGAQKGLPLGNSAKHMANATISWQVSEPLSMFLTAEARSKRYRGQDAATGAQLYYKDYEVLHLGAAYKATDWLTVNVRINNLLDRDFTTYQHSFINNNDGSWTLSTLDDYNNKDKARNFWLSFNVNF